MFKSSAWDGTYTFLCFRILRSCNGHPNKLTVNPFNLQRSKYIGIQVFQYCIYLIRYPPFPPPNSPQTGVHVFREKNVVVFFLPKWRCPYAEIAVGHFLSSPLLHVARESCPQHYLPSCSCKATGLKPCQSLCQTGTCQLCYSAKSCH